MRINHIRLERTDDKERLYFSQDGKKWYRHFDSTNILGNYDMTIDLKEFGNIAFQHVAIPQQRVDYERLVRAIKSAIDTQVPAILKVALEESIKRKIFMPGGLERFISKIILDPEKKEIKPTVIPNIAICQDCGYSDDSYKFPVEPIEELQGQISCPKCGSEDVEY